MQYIFEQILFYFNENPLWQIIWIIAFIFNVFTFVVTNEKRFFILLAICSLLWWIHYHMIWWLSWAYISYLEIFSNLLILKYKKSIKLFFFFLVCYFVILYFTFEPWEIYSFIPVVNASLMAYFSFFLSGLRLKLWIPIVMIFWLIYDVSNFSIWWVVSDVVLFISGIIWIMRAYKEEKLEKLKHKINCIKMIFIKK